MTVDESGVDVSPVGDRGVLKRIIKEGAGTEIPGLGCQVRVHYTGTLLDGTKFDSSKDRNEPFEFTLGKKSVIRAWDIGVSTMRKGEVCMLTCAPEYAYGAAGSPPKIPPNSTLQFEIEMIDWELEDLSPGKNKGILRQIITPPNTESWDSPNDGAIVTVELEGRLPGAEKPFDRRTLTFSLGEGAEVRVPEGIERALEKFQKDEKSKIVLQPRYAFKAEGCAEFGIPPNSVVEYTVHLQNYEKAKETWSMENDEKIDQSKIYKEKGTEYFKAGKYQLAIKMYKRVLLYLDDVSTDESQQFLLSAHLNLALVYLKVTPAHHTEARDHATKALAIDPSNVKGLFRRGQALLGLGEAEQAIADFQKVLDAEPSNKAAAQQITACRAAIKQQKAKEKKLYANMFEKFADKDRERERQAAKQFPDVMGSKLGEWGASEGEWTDEHRQRAPTDFEKENPNILMLDNEGRFQNM